MTSLSTGQPAAGLRLTSNMSGWKLENFYFQIILHRRNDDFVFTEE